MFNNSPRNILIVYNIILEIATVLNIVLINVYGILKKNIFILILYWTGVIFASLYEMHGTGFQWTYPGYNLYLLYDAIPFAVIFGWSWCIVYIAILSEKIQKKVNLKRWYHPFMVDYLVGCLVGGIFENIAVYFDWWIYSNPKPPLLPFVSFTVWLGWGIPVAILIHLARWMVQNLEHKGL